VTSGSRTRTLRDRDLALETLSYSRSRLEYRSGVALLRREKVQHDRSLDPPQSRLGCG
jgi:hypothetical protein